MFLGAADYGALPNFQGHSIHKMIYPYLADLGNRPLTFSRRSVILISGATRFVHAGLILGIRRNQFVTFFLGTTNNGRPLKCPKKLLGLSFVRRKFPT